MIGYHNSKHKFSKPCYEMVKKNRENHGNGELGLWYSTTNDWQKGFGGICYTFEVLGKELRLPFKVFQDLCYSEDSPTFYEDQRNQWLKEGYAFLSIIEQNGREAMGIVLDFGAITYWEVK